MRMVAAEAGVSVMTVSLALRNHPSIPGRTRNRIQRIARKMNYRPNALVATLMAQIHSRRPDSESPVLGLVRESEASDLLNSVPYYQDLLQGARERAQALGYLLEDFFLEPGDEAGRQLHRILHTRGIRGVILAPVFRPGGTTTLPLDGLASCALGYSLHEPLIHRIGSHHGQMMELVWSKLRERDYQRPGFIYTYANLERIRYGLLGGFVAQQILHPELPPVPPLILPKLPETPAEEAECLRDFRKWFRRHHPDVLVAPPWVLMDGIRRLIRIPEEAGAIFFDYGLGWTEVREQAEHIGSGAVDVVVAQIHRNETGVPPFPKTVSINATWIEGDTLPPRKAPVAK